MSNRCKPICAMKPKSLDVETLVNMVNDPCFFCRKCARVANGRGYLCKPKKLPVPVSARR